MDTWIVSSVAVLAVTRPGESSGCSTGGIHYLTLKKDYQLMAGGECAANAGAVSMLVLGVSQEQESWIVWSSSLISEYQ